MHLTGVFAGGLTLLGPEGQLSGIVKRALGARVRVERDGLAGDEHADPRVHGGPEKAVHQYAVAHYARLAAAFPSAAAGLVPGSLGENLSAPGMDEHDVCIGDIYTVGSAVLQVSQPRRPCWKINHRFDVERLSVHIAEHRMTGWYYRVLVPGEIGVGDTIALRDRPDGRFTIDRFWRVQADHRPDPDELEALAAVPGLAPEWCERFAHRVFWLRANRP